ncbi:hypothetical protein [Sneathiella chinensis]|uniref:Sel1 repeat-containing protein n=1 Tax=Sneathiella chinensis TaxID=349750 RepID=A0ABQ5U237_9PROT|nr:hypothetical protein [Sneathiella chinensis]GLQ06242.1 hypothetical protein GCM10007924_14630 [Sneathiella chinensis]
MKRVGLVLGAILLGTSPVLADFQAGLDAYNSKDFATAVTEWQKEASKGDLNSQYNLGLLFEKGVEGYPKDLAAAYGWYRIAASQGVKPAEEALSRLEPLLTAGQIEDGNRLAVEMFGQWYRQNIGQDEQAYQAAKAKREDDRKAKLAAERRLAAERAERQRQIVAQRQADAKMADQLEKESREAAIRAAQEQAEEAKRQALITQRRKEEEERLALLQAEQQKQAQMNAARARLLELQAKQSGTGAVPQTTLIQSEPPVSNMPKTGAGRAAAVPAAPQTQPAPRPAPSPKVTAEPLKAAPAAPSAAPAAAATVQAAPAAPAASTALTSPSQKPAVEDRNAAVSGSNTAEKPQEKPQEKPAQKPVTTTMVPVSSGLDETVVKEIFAAAQSVPLDTPAAKEEIQKGRTDIQSLKWSLISASRGRMNARKMNETLAQTMTPAQVAEANRQAAEWINQRLKRQ